MVVCELIDIIHLETVKGCHMIDLMQNYPSPVHKKQLAASYNHHIDIYEVDNRQPIALLLLFNHPHPCVFIGRITNIGIPLNKGNIVASVRLHEGEKEVKLCH